MTPDVVINFSAQVSLRPRNRVFGLYLSLSAWRPNRSKLLTCWMLGAVGNSCRTAQAGQVEFFPAHFGSTVGEHYCSDRLNSDLLG